MVKRPANKTVRYAIEAAGLYLLAGAFACLPVDWASAVGGWIARLAGPRLGASRRALSNLQIAFPENSDARNRAILKQMWENLGRSIGEFPHLDRIVAPGSGRVEIVNGEGLEALLRDGKPGVVFGGHFGNWEVGPATIHHRMGDTLLSVYRAPNNPWVDRLMQRRLSRRSVPKGASGGRALLRHLQGGGHVAMLVDQKMDDGIAVPFFGRDAMTAPAAARMALRTACPLVPVRTERLGGAHFRFTVLPPLDLEGAADSPAAVQRVMTRINALIEEWVRAGPEQWLWLHRRWSD